MTEDIVADGRAAWQRLRRGASFEDWVRVARALIIGRAEAMREAKANKPMGSRYSAAFGAWLDANELRGISNQERYRAILVIENLTEVENWRASLDDARRRRLNHPGAIWWAWRRATKPATAAPRRMAEARRPARAKAANGRAVFFDQAMLRRAVDSMRESRSNDLCTLAVSCLRAALRNQDDVRTLLDEPRPRAKADRAPADMHAIA